MNLTPNYTQSPPNSFIDLQQVISKDGGLNASASRNFKNRIFGRDSLEAAEDLLPIYPDIVKEVIFSLAKLQGVKNNPHTEEEPGRIHHEYFKGDENEIGVLRYDSVDATPLYIRLIASYVRRYGRDILDETFTDKSGKRATITDSLHRAIQWLEGRLRHSSLHLLEYKKVPLEEITVPENPDPFEIILRNDLTPGGHIENQVWTDSFTAMINPDGTIGNYTKPIAAIEVQGIVYDALNEAVFLFPKHSHAQTWIQLAKEVQTQTFKLFWLPDQAYFARAIERDKYNHPHRIETLASMPAELLDTGIFDNLSASKKQVYLFGIISMIFSHEFLTDVGIRSRALRHKDVLSIIDYHGSYTSWIKETYDIAKGLRRQGLPRLAEQLEIRIMNAINISGNHYEFFYVDADGDILFQQPEEEAEKAEKSILYATNIPEDKQTWTITAAIAVKHKQTIVQEEHTEPEKLTMKNIIPFIHSRFVISLLTARHIITRPKQHEKTKRAFEDRLLASIPLRTILETQEELYTALTQSKLFHIDISGGQAREKELYRSMEVDNERSHPLLFVSPGQRLLSTIAQTRINLDEKSRQRITRGLKQAIFGKRKSS